ncbi:SMC flexible hinge domain protein, putative [Trichomonas vaginalis G3]|uniref:SMC flexible hinge domain protein, putative n=1 Tax=Trichomonas vaginalis (strain ATCC PRA-98 / G3) TaxID=412133 RepID=A2DH38_TRIV3|nr:structural maintenance of chromosomes protein 3 family [Trichomonas vaginalis G3]EAY20348.1 SMC flexible hinge domain protein, putative [Trichomonas vaginalis G3]KAI5530661.1 structural maintenance of chromosomes protein 3 family [Trichomonas vaginalis G3]|eukprot:XP_001581334.1 SMC flexible hinge domain protein [Trichomonas vaginalis G3]
MNIKKVVISGFKAFADTTIFGPFSPGKNCILGLNGSGKTTLFQAIEFVLLENYSMLPHKNRIALLHSGNVQKNRAFVEITFDNTNRMFSIDKQEFSIRREIGMQKDEYFIDRKHSMRNDIVSLFNSANISLNNETFIIQQNRVKGVAEMSDEDRLCLFFDISGIQVYTDKRQESVKMIAESDERRKKIGESIEYIDYKIEQLEKEREELESFFQLDKKKRALEYIIYDRQKNEAEEQIKSIDEIRSNQSTVLEELRNSFEEISNEINDLSRLIQESTNNQDNLQSSITSFEEMIEKTITKTENSKLKLESLEKKLNRSSEQQEQIPIEINNLKEKLKGAETKKDEMKNELFEKKTEIGQLNAKIFKHKSDLDKKYNQMKFQVESNENKIFDISNKINNNNKQIEDIEREIQNQKEQLHVAKQNFEISKKEFFDSLDNRKQAWKQESDIVKRKSQLQKSISEYKLKYQQNSFYEIVNFIKKQNIDGINGPLIDLIDLKSDSDIAPAIDAVGGKKLFAFVADDDKSAKKLNEKLSETKFGSVQIILLNRLQTVNRKIPTTNQMKPLTDFIVVKEEKFQKIVDYVFGNFGLCPTLDSAIDESETQKVNTVTVSGDVNYYNGLMTGGYRNPLNSIPILHFNLMKLQNEMSELEKSEVTIKEKVSESEEQISEASKNQIKRENDIQSIKEKINSLIQKSDSLKSDNSVFSSRLEDLKSKQIKLQPELLLVKSEVNAEKNDENLSEEEINEISEKLAVLTGESISLELKIGSQTSFIQSLNEKITKLMSENVDTNKLKSDIDKLKSDIVNYEDKREDLKNKLNDYKNELIKVKNELKENTKILTEKTKTQNEIKNKIRHQQSSFENLTTQFTLQNRLAKEATERRNFITPIPEEEIAEYKEFSDTRIRDVFDQINTELSLFRHVNKKADDQFFKFAGHKKELERNLQEIDDSRKSLIELISELDSKKRSAFESFFAKLSYHFKDIYHKLEPTRNCQIVLQRESSNLGQEEETPLKGVAFRFDDFFIEQMSGGQKTICAISFLLAIQKTTPTPFYLFDEIDADLDPQHRKNLSEVISEMANADPPSQFIFSTFRPEMLEVSDKFFGISNMNNKSTSKEMTLEEAVSFIESEQTLPAVNEEPI